MTDPTTELTALHTLAESCPGGVAGCAWWNKALQPSYQYEDTFEIEDELGNFVPISDQHAHDLVVAHAERWLVGKGWDIARSRDGCGYTPDGCITEFDSLPDALTYAMEHT